MSLQWIHESAARWDAGKQRIVGGAPAGIFELGGVEVGALVPGDWWRVEDEAGETIGYGWMDIVGMAGDAEVLLAVDSAHQGKGAGTFIMDHLEREAADRGLNYLSNIVRPSHPDKEGITAWLKKRGYVERGDGQLARLVKAKP
ncbi:MAG: GNAT family N-acetyltransferase [Myxococcales bacterium]|nr:GNAT family N-acetyltransferase [Myxococcales bacterium]